MLGGFAGLIGAMLQKAGFAWGRFVTIIGIVAGLQLSQRGAADWIKMQALSPETASQALIATYPTFFTFVRDVYPNDFQQLTVQVTDIIKSDATNAEVRQMSQNAVASIRRKYAPMVALASDADQAGIIDSLITFYTALNESGYQLCNAVAINGPAALNDSPNLQQFLTMVEPQALMGLRAAANAMASPTQRRAVTDDDWAEVGEAMIARGATEAQLNAFGSLDPNSPDLCPALLIMMKTLNEVQTEGVKAVRAQYVADLSAA